MSTYKLSIGDRVYCKDRNRFAVLHHIDVENVHYFRFEDDSTLRLDEHQVEPVENIETRNKVRRAVGSVLFNASNFPERAQVGILGADMGPLNEKITDAVLKALGEKR